MLFSHHLMVFTSSFRDGPNFVLHGNALKKRLVASGTSTTVSPSIMNKVTKARVSSAEYVVREGDMVVMISP